MTPDELKVYYARMAFGALNCPAFMVEANAAYLAQSLGSDGETAFPVDANGNRRYRPASDGSGRDVPVTVEEYIVEVLGNPATHSAIAWKPYGWTPALP